MGATNTYTRNIGSLGPGAFTVVTIGLKIDLSIPVETTQIDNVVLIGDDGTLGRERIITNNISYEHTPLRYVDLAVDKTDNVSVVNVGDVVTYHDTVTNKGIVNANGVQIIDPLVKGMVQATWNCVAAQGSSCNAVAGTGPISTTANIGVKSYVLYTLRVLVAACDGLVPNKVTVIPPAGLTDPHPEDNVGLDVDTDGTGANILMNAIFPPIYPGGTFTPTVVLGNYGPDIATNVSTTLALPPGFTIDQLILSQGSYNSATGLWTVGTLQVGQIVTMSLRTDMPAVGGPFTPTVVLGNFGPDVATNVSTTLALPFGFTIDQFILSQGSYNAVTGLWMVGTLQVGQTVTMSLRTAMTSTFTVGQSVTLTVNIDSSAVGNSPQRSQIVIVVSEQPPVIAGPQFNGFSHYLPIVNR